MSFAIFGGSFNPLHLGHMYIADEVRAALGYDSIIFIPSNISAHKPSYDIVSPGDRLEMLIYASQGINWMEVDDREIKRGGVSYSIDTVKELYNERIPEEKPGLIIGDDLVSGLEKWKDRETLMDMVNLIIVRRAKGSISVPFPFKVVNTLSLEISSSDIRRRIAENRPFQYLIPEKIFHYIDEKGLYR